LVFTDVASSVMFRSLVIGFLLLFYDRLAVLISNLVYLTPVVLFLTLDGLYTRAVAKMYQPSFRQTKRRTNGRCHKYTGNGVSISRITRYNVSHNRLKIHTFEMAICDCSPI